MIKSIILFFSKNTLFFHPTVKNHAHSTASITRTDGVKSDPNRFASLIHHACPRMSFGGSPYTLVTHRICLLGSNIWHIKIEENHGARCKWESWIFDVSIWFYNEILFICNQLLLDKTLQCYIASSKFTAIDCLLDILNTQ